MICLDHDLGSLAQGEELEYPRKGLKVVVPFAPGGASDTVVRVLQQGIAEAKLSPVPFTVFNVPGAGGTIGSRRVLHAAPDGYQILNLHDGLLTAQANGKAHHGVADFEPIAATGVAGSMMCVGPTSTHESLTSLLEAAAASGCYHRRKQHRINGADKGSQTQYTPSIDVVRQLKLRRRTR